MGATAQVAGHHPDGHGVVGRWSAALRRAVAPPSPARSRAAPFLPLPRASATLARLPATRSWLVAAANDPRLLRAISAPVRRLRPILVLGRTVIVTRHDDVLEVLARDQDLTIAEVNAVSMDRVNGPFILGLDRSPLYDRERRLLGAAVRPGDPERVRASVRATAAELVATTLPAGRLDVVQDLVRPAATRLVADYFGVPGPDPETMMRWMRAVFWETFLNVGADPDVRRAGVDAAGALHTYTDELIARRRAELAAGDEVPDDVLTRLVEMQADPATRLSDEAIRRNITGVVVGAVDTTSKATAHAVDELLRRPAALRRTHEAAVSGDLDVVAGHAFEALRFNPLSPVLGRHSARDLVLAAGTRRARAIPAGRRVYAAVLPAMFDPSAVASPWRFRADRPPSTYIHFGGGLHPCFGRYVNEVQIPELVAALLRCDDVRRAPAPHGAMAYEGPFPDRLLVDLGTAPTGGRRA